MLTKNDLSQIKTVVQKVIHPEIKALDMEIKTLKKNMATKDDLKSMASKDDLKKLETDLKGDTKTGLKTLETGLRGEIKTLETGLEAKFETGLKGLEKRLIERIDDAQMEIIATVDKHKADKETVAVLEKRVDRLEDNAGLPPLPTQ